MELQHPPLLSWAPASQTTSNSGRASLSLKVSRYKTITIGNAQEQIGETPTTTKGTPAGQSKKAPPPAAIAGEALVTLTVNSTVVMGQ